MARENWEQIKKTLKNTLGHNDYTTWIEPLKIYSFDNNILSFEVPTAFFGTWVVRNFKEAIQNTYSKNGIKVERVEFYVPRKEEKCSPSINAQRPNNAHFEKSEQPSMTKNKGHSFTSRTTPNTRFTFDTFVVGKPNELAHAAARRVAEGGSVTFNPLFLYGGVGLGKTHLMHAIINELRTTKTELNVLYLSAEQFMYRFVQALREKQVMGFKELFRSVDVLMVDDVQFIAGKDSTQEEFFHTFNTLVEQNKQIVISADRLPGEIKGLEDRIKSRLQCGLVVDIHPTDYELRLGILQSKVEEFQTQYAGLTVSDDVIEFLAHRITSNVRVLEGALTRLYAFESLVGREITLDLAQECLSDILRLSEKHLTIEEIQRKVAEHYNIRISDMAGSTRLRTIARPRQIAMYLCKQLTPKSLPEIGRRFGGRDHTTIMHGVRKIEELMGSGDPQLTEDIHLLRRLLRE